MTPGTWCRYRALPYIHVRYTVTHSLDLCAALRCSAKHSYRIYSIIIPGPTIRYCRSRTVPGTGPTGINITTKPDSGAEIHREVDPHALSGPLTRVHCRPVDALSARRTVVDNRHGLRHTHSTNCPAYRDVSHGYMVRSQASGAPNLDVRLTRSQSGSILDIDFVGGKLQLS